MLKILLLGNTGQLFPIICIFSAAGIKSVLDRLLTRPAFPAYRPLGE